MAGDPAGDPGPSVRRPLPTLGGAAVGPPEKAEDAGCVGCPGCPPCSQASGGTPPMARSRSRQDWGAAHRPTELPDVSMSSLPRSPLSADSVFKVTVLRTPHKSYSSEPFQVHGWAACSSLTGLGGLPPTPPHPLSRNFPTLRSEAGFPVLSPRPTSRPWIC